VQYLKDLFLGPQTKLFKIGAFLYDGVTLPAAAPTGWEAVVYDKQMTPKNRDGAANYFYESFLGCTIPVNSAQLTRRFFEETRAFINLIDVPDEKKSDLLTDLYTYLKVDQSPTVEIAAFSNQYLGPELKDDYETFMQGKSFPTNAVSKDTSDIQAYATIRMMCHANNPGRSCAVAKPGRPSSRTAHQVRSCYQSDHGQSARHHGSAGIAGHAVAFKTADRFETRFHTQPPV
jgi:hypothetical protein